MIGILSDKVVRPLENRLFLERDQLALWVPVALGGGIAAWFILPGSDAWLAWILGGTGLAGLGAAIGTTRRFGLALVIVGLALALGCGLVWVRSALMAAPVLERPIVAAFAGRVERVQPLPARGTVRLVLATDGSGGVPPRVRVTVPEAQAVPPFAVGEAVRLRARLVPPPQPAVPGAYDFARVAWFDGIGATGRAIGAVGRDPQVRAPPLRDRLSAHIRSRLPPAEGAVAAALATGDQGAIPEADAEAMRRSGLAHLLSISGLHVTAVFAGTVFLLLRLLAFSSWLALRLPLLLIATAGGALAALGYTLLSGSEIPTVRALAAALLVALAMALGREAITLRLVAAGALFVLLVWPHALVGPSFQLSFAAITAIVALHEQERVKAWFARREEGLLPRTGRSLAALLLTGVAVEVALMPIALFHFHRAGLYGALANIVAIPLTTFVIMPLEALALLFDLPGLGAPFWWLTGKALALLLWMAHVVASAPGAVTTLPAAPAWAFALSIAGGLWICLWKTRWRWWGALPSALGLATMLLAPVPDLVITGDGRHVALVGPDGRPVLLRARAGDYVRDTLAEAAGHDGDAGTFDELSAARCNSDVCAVDIDRGERRWRLLATRSPHLVPIGEIVAACREADIVVSERRLPRTCTPRWLKLDRPMLARTGGLAIHLEQERVITVAETNRFHPWGVGAAGR